MIKSGHKAKSIQKCVLCFKQFFNPYCLAFILSFFFFFLSTKVRKLPDWLGTFFEEPVDFLCLYGPSQSSKMHVRLNGDYIESGVDIVSAINQ